MPLETWPRVHGPTGQVLGSMCSMVLHGSDSDFPWHIVVVLSINGSMTQHDGMTLLTHSPGA